MKHLLIGAAAAMTLAGAATIANAQGQDERNKGPAAEGKAPGAPGAQREPGAGNREQSQQPNRTEPKAEPRRGAEKEPGRDQPRAGQQQPKDQPKSTQGSQPGKDQPKSADRPQQGKDQPQGKDQQKATQQQQSKDRPGTTDVPKSRTDANKSATPQQTDKDRKGDRVKVTEQERGGVRERLGKEKRVERTRINVSVSIGRAIPRSVRLHRLPVSIVSFAPAYRDYSYIVLEDETICIVDERTYVIVDIIPAGSQRADGPGRGQLALSSDQMRYVFISVPKDRIADVRVRLALGAEVPREVELNAFPGDVLGRVPELERYRYVVAGGDVIIVDPSDNAVVLVINE